MTNSPESKKSASFQVMALSLAAGALALVAFRAAHAEPTPTPVTQPSAFSFDGAHLIHPMSVAPLVGDLASEQPSVASVDLEGSAQQKCNAVKVTNDGGIVEARDGENGFVAYRFLGTTPGGLHVLIVMVNGGVVASSRTHSGCAWHTIAYRSKISSATERRW